MRYISLALALTILFFNTGARAQENTVITDGRQPFAEGVLRGYEVQANGKSLCRDPIAYGRYIACSGKSSKRVYVEVNGVLGAYIVVDRRGREVCRDPLVYNKFRGPNNYIVCN